jgi:hypothetical protein
MNRPSLRKHFSSLDAAKLFAQAQIIQTGHFVKETSFGELDIMYVTDLYSNEIRLPKIVWGTIEIRLTDYVWVNNLIGKEVEKCCVDF